MIFALGFLVWLHMVGSDSLGHGAFGNAGVGNALLLMASGALTVLPLLLFATAAQRIVLHAKERGCTRPGCSAPGYRAQVHHAVADWKDDGQTDIDELTFACGPDHRMLDKTQWRTRKNAKNQTEWLPPPDLDTGQHRTNGYHHPERYLLPEDDEGP